MNGNMDKPIERFDNDEFDISSYITGLSEFIRECETPMTVAIQGDWGCGKTSMMNMVRDKLSFQEEIIDIWFNTWQFSQFNMDEQLVLTFLKHLIKQLEKVIKNNEKKQKICTKLNSIMRTVTVGMTKHFVGEEFVDTIDCIMDNEKENDIVYEIMELKQSFQELIFETGRRVVIFIDDLDRLQPVRAVELLEVLKLFIDCENCVFVMAIDTSVVFQGIREKYGTDITNEKAQSFFDKLIQLPFKMPVVYYKLDGMIQRLLSFLKEENLPKEEIEKYIRLIRKTTAGNPRSIKRLTNSFLLIDKVAVKKKIYSSEEAQIKTLSRKLLLILSCLQMKYEAIYEFLLKEMSYRFMSQIYDFSIPQDNIERFDKLIKSLENIGFPELSISGKDVFYDIMVTFIKTCKEFIDTLISGACNSYKNYSKKDSIYLLMQVISLNGLISDREENDLNNNFSEKTYETNTEINHTQSTEQVTENLGFLYTGMIAIGQSMQVYRELIEKNIFPCLSTNMQSGKEEFVNNELNEYKEKRILVENFFLYKEIDTIVSKHYKKSSKISNIDTKNCYTYTTYAYQITKYDEFKVHIDYDEFKKYLTCTFFNSDLSLIKPNYKGFSEMCKFVEEIKKYFEELRQTYGEFIFPNKENVGMPSVEEKFDEQGNFIGYKSISFGILSKQMADRLVDFLVKAINHKEDFFGKVIKYKYTDNLNPIDILTARYTSGDFLIDLE